MIGDWARPVVAAAAGLAVAGSVATAPAPAVTYGRKVAEPVRTAPWVVPIYWSKNRQRPQAICTGSLFAPQFVLTAAHCVKGMQAGNFAVQIGGNRLRQGTRIDVDGWWINPRYSSSTLEKDVAVLHLLQPAAVASMPALATTRAVPAYGLTIYGWGENEHRRQTGDLQAARLDRADGLAKWDFGGGFHRASMVGALRYNRSQRGYSGACSGDSGGPLTAVIGGRETVVGITSYGADRCGIEAPTVFTRVGFFSTAIAGGMRSAEQMAANDSQAPPRVVSAPTITGTPLAGQVLTCTPGQWSGGVRRFEYDWTLDGEPVDGHTPSVAVDSAWAGGRLTCEVIAIGSRGRTGQARVSIVIP